jgi:hypothetical protein
MAGEITDQQLIDAATDATNLGLIVNGPASGAGSTVVVRTGQQVPTLARAGATIAQGPPGQSLNDRGMWAANTVYAPLDLFTAPDNNSYRVLTAFTSGNAFVVNGNIVLNAKSGTDGATTPNFTAPVEANHGVYVGSSATPLAQGLIISAGTDPGSFVISDRKGNVILYVDAAGVVQAGSIYARKLQADTFSCAQIVVGVGSLLMSALADAGLFMVKDRKGAIPVYVDEAGVLQVGAANIRSLTATTFTQTSTGPQLQGIGKGVFDYELMYFPSYGQSLSIGTWSILPNAAGPYVFSTVPVWDNLMFVGGTLPLANTASAANYASLVPLVEQLYGSNNGNWQPPANGLTAYNLGSPGGETPVSGALQTIKHMLSVENNLQTADIDFQFIGSCPGKGGSSISQLSSGTAPYTRLLDEITRAKAFADAQGKIFGVPAVCWTQGENDNGESVATYTALADALFVQMNTDIKAITGQTKNVQILMYQTFGNVYGSTIFNIALAQLALGNKDANVGTIYPNYHCVCSAYMLQTDFADATHLSAQASKQLGGYYGKAFKKIIVDNNPTWSPLPVQTVQMSGAYILITVGLDKTGLVIDTTNYTTENGAQPNAGFTLVDGSGNPVAITSVTIVGQNRIKVLCSTPPVAGMILRYGAANTNGGLGGNIRDNDGSIYTVDCGGVPAPLHNWFRQWSHTF